MHKKSVLRFCFGQLFELLINFLAKKFAQFKKSPYLCTGISPYAIGIFWHGAECQFIRRE